MRKNQFLSNLLATTFICGAASFATPAFAQSDQQQPQSGQGAAAQPDDQGQEVVITGSRIPAPPNLTAVSPVTVVNSAEIRLQGTTRTEDLINSLPQSFGGQGGNLANGASGTATVNLRGLGTNRTMVLVNGRRLGPGDPETPNPDINVIPSAIVSRVDVLTGGASSVYGSDAVSGVVNFIMDTELQGVRLDAQYSFYQHDNDNARGLNAALDLRGFGYPTGSVADGGKDVRTGDQNTETENCVWHRRGRARARTERRGARVPRPRRPISDGCDHLRNIRRRRRPPARRSHRDDRRGI